MHRFRLLERWLERNCEFVHRSRVKALLKVVVGLIEGEKATLSQMGRNLVSGAYEKHNIKCVDRLVGNERLWGERREIYAAMASWLIGSQSRPWLIVDWSDVEVGSGHKMLKAAVVFAGRALTVYEEVHALSRYASPKVERAFLGHLKEVIPPGCRPVLITDAGFRGPWFRAVESYGWDWIGRVRNMVKCSADGRTRWMDVRQWYAQATGKAQALGWHWLSKGQPYGCWLHVYRGKRRRAPGRRRRKVAHETRVKRLAKDPWLLGTSLSGWTAAQVVGAYDKRMQIEETFRDLKNDQWGYGLSHARSKSSQRLENLLLLTTLATLATTLVGLVARLKGLTRHFQANTTTERTVLSLFFLGRRMLKSARFRVTQSDFDHAIRTLPKLLNPGVRTA